MIPSTYLARLGTANEFQQADLVANRQGRITPTQLERLGDNSRVVQAFAGIVASMGLLFGIVALATWHLRNGVGTGMAAVAAACFLVAVATVRRSREVRSESAAPHIAVYEGLVTKLTSVQVPPARARTSAYFYAVEGAHLPVGPEGYEALDESVPHRVYYLVRTQQLLSIEPLPSGAS